MAVRITALRLDMQAGDHPFVVHAALLQDEQETVLIDTGIPGQMDAIRSAMAQHGASLDKLTKIIITHQDRDHIGSLPELVAASQGRIQVMAHERAKPYLAGETPLVKSGAFATPVDVDVALNDGDVLPYCGGIEVVFTPGHTPDHISLYHIPSKTLVSGDALTSQDGILKPFDPKFTPGPETAWASIRKLLRYDIETVIAYHGGVCAGDIRARLEAMLESAPA